MTNRLSGSFFRSSGAGTLPGVVLELYGSPDYIVESGAALSFRPTHTFAYGETLTYSIVNMPEGAEFDTTNATLTWASAVEGIYLNITISVSSSNGDTFTLLPFNLEVSTPHPQLTIGGTPDTYVEYGIWYAFFPIVTGRTGTVWLSAENLPAWLTMDEEIGIYGWVPDENTTFSNIILIATDDVDSASMTFDIQTVTVIPNEPPTISGTPETIVTAEEAYNFQPSAADPENATLEFSIVNKPTWATFVTATGQLYGTPDILDVGTTSNIVISVTDSVNAAVDLAAFNLEVQAPPGLPEPLTFAGAMQYQVTTFDLTATASDVSTHYFLKYSTGAPPAAPLGGDGGWVAIADPTAITGTGTLPVAETAYTVYLWTKDTFGVVSTTYLTISLTSQAAFSFTSFIVRSPVYSPVGESIPFTYPSLDETIQTRAQYGIIDVSLAPFSADTSGVADATDALNSAIDFCRCFSMMAYFPAGATFIVSDTINVRQGVRNRTSGAIGNDREGPVVCVGSKTGVRPSITLATGSTGFNNSAIPKPVVHLWACSTNASYAPSYAAAIEAGNVQMNTQWDNIDVSCGTSNRYAFAMRNAGSQGCTIENTKLTATGAFACTRGGTGGGGHYLNVEFEDGDYGLDMRTGVYIDDNGHAQTSAIPVPLLVGCTWTGQLQNAVIGQHPQCALLVGCDITVPTGVTGDTKAPLYVNVSGATLLADGTNKPNFSPSYGWIIAIDTVIRFTTYAATNTAVNTSRSFYFKNLYTQNAGTISKSRGFYGTTAAYGTTYTKTGGSGWKHLAEYARGVVMPLQSSDGTSDSAQYEACHYLNGVRYDESAAYEVAGVDQDPATGDAAIQSRHIPTGMPHFESAGVRNVKSSHATTGVGSYPLTGNGVADDTANIAGIMTTYPAAILFFPKGFYTSKKTISAPANIKLIGLHRSFSQFLARETYNDTTGANGTFGNISVQNPLLETASDASGTLVLSNIGLFAGEDKYGASSVRYPGTMGAYCLNWRVGASSIVNNINVENRSMCGYAAPAGMYKQVPDFKVGPIVKASGHGGGRWYNYHQGESYKQGPDYRHLLIDGIDQALTIYTCNMEHSDGDANAEIVNVNTGSVKLYAIKGEGNYPQVYAHDCAGTVEVHGFGGRYVAYPNEAMTVGSATFTGTYPAGHRQVPPGGFLFDDCDEITATGLIEQPNYVMTGTVNPVFGFGLLPSLWNMLVHRTADVVDYKTTELDRPIMCKWSVTPVAVPDLLEDLFTTDGGSGMSGRTADTTEPTSSVPEWYQTSAAGTMPITGGACVTNGAGVATKAVIELGAVPAAVTFNFKLNSTTGTNTRMLFTARRTVRTNGTAEWQARVTAVAFSGGNVTSWKLDFVYIYLVNGVTTTSASIGSVTVTANPTKIQSYRNITITDSGALLTATVYDDNGTTILATANNSTATDPSLYNTGKTVGFGTSATAGMSVTRAFSPS